MLLLLLLLLLPFASVPDCRKTGPVGQIDLSDRANL